jgi:NADH:ubiquinone oxidoreductase subunit 6 (subunit J)
MTANPTHENEVATADVVAEAMMTQVQESEDTEEMSRYLKLPSVVMISIVLCLATFCVAVDNTIISTAVPRITKTFDSIDDVGWYASYVSYNLPILRGKMALKLTDPRTESIH